MKDVTVAAVNFLPTPLEVEENLAKMDFVSASAAKDGADLVCFPELSVTGHHLPEVSRIAEPIDGPTAQSIARISDDCGICVSAGFVELRGDKTHITHVLAEGGEIVGAYRKTHLGHNERIFFDAGDEIPVFDTSFGKVGISLCWESRFPEIPRILAVKGADIILMPYASGPGGRKRRGIWNRYLPARAGDSTVYLVACNMLRRERGSLSGGGVTVLDFKGNTVVEDYSFDEKTVLVQLDASGLEKAREGGIMGKNHYLLERKPELYDALTSKQKLK